MNPYGGNNMGAPNPYGQSQPDPNANSGWSTGQKVALGGVAAVGLAGVAAVGAAAIGIGGYKFYQSHQGSDQDKSPLKLYMHVKSARSLQAADRGKTSDPYVVLSQGYISVKTQVVKKNLNPHWDERLEMGVYERDLQAGELHVKVFDKDTLRDDSLGSVRVPLSHIPHNTPKEFNLNLVGGESKINNGSVKISLHFGRVQGMQPGPDARAIGGYPGAPQQGGYPPQGGNPYGAPMGGAPMNAPGYGSGYPPQQGPPGGFGAPGYGSGYPPQQGPPGGFGAPMGAPGYGSGYPPQQGPPGGFGAPMGAPGYGSGYPPQQGPPGGYGSGYPPNPY